MTIDLFANKGYGTLLLDPPWNEKGAGKSKRGADRHYPLLTTRRIVEVLKDDCPIKAAESAHCYLWVTNNFLRDGLMVLESIGFRYVTNLVWVKPNFGLGRYFRGQHELCLFGVRGRFIPTRTNNTPTVIHALRRRHSQKPSEFYGLIEQNSPGPRAELFARSTRPGWDSWGNEV